MVLQKIVRILAAFVMLAVAVSVSTPLYAQAVGATLSGTVTDPTGALVPNAHVTITDVATGITRTVNSNTAGVYTAPNLLPASYDVSVAVPGFRTQVSTGVILTVGAQQVLDIRLQVGEATQKVEVTGAAPTVDLASSELSGEVDGTTVRELPLNGRSWVDLGSLQPGVNQPNTQLPLTVAGRGQRGFGTQVSIMGARPDENLYRVDGIIVNDYADSSPSNVLGGALGVDAIQEFTVLTGLYPAEYGRSSGGVFNAITRSGTNQIHGTAYEFVRNSALDAPNYFDTAAGLPEPPFTRNQFGASLGAPIAKDATFIFVNYEGLRQSLGVTQSGTTLSANARNGILSTGTVAVDPHIAAFIAAIYPTANGPVLGDGDTAKFSNSIQQVATDNFGTARFDHKFSNADLMDAVYTYDSSQETIPDLQNTKAGLFSTGRQTVALEETHIFNGQMLNTLRFGYNRPVATVGATIGVIPGVSDPQFAAIPGGFAPAVSVPGLSTFTGGVNGTPYYIFHYNSYQVYDDAFLTKGIHSIKFGVGFERIQDNDGARVMQDGTFQFPSISAFLQNQPSRFTGAVTKSTSILGIRESIVGAYVQDDIRARSNLTLNVGLRYEFATVPTEVHNQIANLKPPTAAQPTLGSPWFSNFTTLNFEPRIGFAWDPFGTGKTAVRGGFGIYDVLPTPYELFLGNATTAPVLIQGSVASQAGSLNGAFPSGAYSLVAGNPATFKYSYVDPNPKRRYVMQWNMNVQRELTPSLRLMVGYAGSRGLHLPQHEDDMDFVIPYLTPAGYVFPFGPAVNKLNPNIGILVGELMGNHSWYNALQVELTKKMSHGFFLHGSYTWGKSEDYTSGTFAGDQFYNGITTQPWFAPQIFRGLSDFDIRNNLVIDGTWNVPTPKGSALEQRLLGGWELGAIFKATSGVPFTPNFGGGNDPAGTLGSDPSFLVPDVLKGPGCGTLVNPGNANNYIKAQCFTVPTAPNMAFWSANCNPAPGGTPVPYPDCFNLLGNAGRNGLIGPGLVNLDFSLIKNTYVSERFNIQIRWEIFNLLNRANFAVPSSTTLFDATGANVSSTALITSTQTPAREMQLGVKLIW